MAAPTVEAIVDGFVDRLSTVANLRAYAFVPGQFSPPAAIVGMPRRVQVETFSRATDTYEVEVWVVVSRQADVQSQKTVARYLNPTGDYSVRAAIHGDVTLGGVLGGSAIHELRAEPVDFEFGDTVYIGLEFTFQFVAPGKD